MPNIKFSYLYRDGANYKKFHSVIFSNPTNIDLQEIETLIRSKLIFGEWFYVDQWKLPDLHFETWDKEIDHTFHEFESVEYTDEPSGGELCIEEFKKTIKNSKIIYQ